MEPKDFSKMTAAITSAYADQSVLRRDEYSVTDRARQL
jgi:hypothetical protein